MGNIIIEHIMKYLNFDTLNKIDAEKYRHNKPYPYIEISAPLYDDAYRLLVQSAPDDLSLFEKQFGIERGYGQKFHDKYYLLYSDSTPLSQPWKEFVAELYSHEYRRFIESLFNIKRNNYDMALSWHYMPRGTQITPHCDTKKKIGSQLFYLNTSEIWKSEWGGQTLALDDEGERDWRSGPKISEFKNFFQSKSVNNNSFIFTRTDHSWHAVDELKCPDGYLRKMFSVVVNRKPSFYKKMRGVVKHGLNRF